MLLPFAVAFLCVLIVALPFDKLRTLPLLFFVTFVTFVALSDYVPSSFDAKKCPQRSIRGHNVTQVAAPEVE